MLAALGRLVRNIGEISRRREVIATPVLEELLGSTFSGKKALSNFYSPAGKAPQNRIHLLPSFEEGSELPFSAFKPSQLQPSLVAAASSQSQVMENPKELRSIGSRLTLLQKSPCYLQRRALSFQQTGLKQTCSSNRTQDAWHLKMFAFFILFSLLSRSNSVSASENNAELSWDELKEIAKDLHIEGIDDPKALQQECFTRLMSLCLRERDSASLKALDAKKIAKLKDLGGNSLLIASIREGASISVYTATSFLRHGFGVK